MLRVSDHFHATDTGRMRQGNEDNFYVRSPLFAVCDGMGGAQAGEVASEIAARSFEAGVPNGEPPEAALANIIETANAKIHERSRSDAGRAGMGCTCTAAYVDEEGIAIAHVGDSRAYRLRDGEMTQITRDHSLVADLIELGKITPEEAERHPQRSVITRALGPEPEVEIDTRTHGAKPGDLYLLCSDGLTSMVPDARIQPVLAGDGDLPAKGRELIAAANAAGGRDNITVILFEVQEAKPRSGAGGGEGGTTTELDSGEQETGYLDYDEAELAEPGPRQGITKAEAEAAAPAREAPARAPDAEVADWEANRPATVALSAIKPSQKPPPPPQQPPASRTVQAGRSAAAAAVPRRQHRQAAGDQAHRAAARRAQAQARPLPRLRDRRHRRDRDPADRRLARHAGGLLRRRRHHQRQRGRDLPRPALRAARRRQALRALRRLGRDAGAACPVPARDVHRPQAPFARRRRGPGQPVGAGPARVSARNRELLALIPASLLLTAGFAAIFVQQSDVVDDLSLTYGAWFLALCVAAHLVLRFTLPYADPYLFPLVAVLACFGLVVIYRIDEELAREQAQWFIVGLVLFAATILLLREDVRLLERYRYTIALVGLGLLLSPRLPGIGQEVNGAFLGVKLGPVSFQPAEFGKIAIVVFLASYLRDTRQVLVLGGRRILGVTIPPLKQFGPILVIWGAAMCMLIFIRDLGSSLMFFGGFLALLYVATNRLSFPVIGTAMFALGAWFIASPAGRVLPGTGQVEDRVEVWLDPFNPDRVETTGYQLTQSLFAQADGGVFGTGFGQALVETPGGQPLLPAPETDLIYAVITNELGLAGACGLLLVYMLFAERGFKTAMLAQDSFSKLLATGLTAVFALQVFVIVGGVTRVIPLTGVTLPFVSYGGSSIVANFVLLALLLLVSDRARRPLTPAKRKRVQ